MTTPQETLDVETIQTKIQRIVIEALHAQKAANSINLETRLDTLGLDSLNVVDVLLGIEETFGIALDDEAIQPETVESIASLATFVIARQGQS